MNRSEGMHLGCEFCENSDHLGSTSYITDKDGFVYGNLTFKRYPNHTCRAYADTYDFDYKSNKNPANRIRNHL